MAMEGERNVTHLKTLHFDIENKFVLSEKIFSFQSFTEFST